MSIHRGDDELLSTNESWLTTIAWGDTTEISPVDPWSHSGTLGKVLEILSLLFIILNGTIWNILVLVAILKRKTRLNGIHTMLIINLCVTDLGMSTVGMGFTLFDLILGQKTYLQASPVLCHINGFLVAVFPAVNVQTVATIAAHRYLLTCHPHHKILNKRRARLGILLIWVVSSAVAGLPLFDVVSHISYSSAVHHCHSDFHHPCIYGYLCMAVYAVTLPVSAFCYGSIMRSLFAIKETINLHNKRRNVDHPLDSVAQNDMASSTNHCSGELMTIRSATVTEGGTNSDIPSTKKRRRVRRRKKRLAADKRIAVASGLILLTTLICWSPFAITNVCFFEAELQHGWSVFIMWLAYTNSVFDPIIYVYFNKKVATRIRSTIRIKR